MTRLVYTPQSKKDLSDIGLYIARDNPRRAMSFVRELREQCRKITQAPKAYRYGQSSAKACAHAPMATTSCFSSKSLVWCVSSGCCMARWISMRSSLKKILLLATKPS